MVNINELRSQKAEVKAAATRLIDKSVASGKDIAGDDLTAYQSYVARLDTLEKQIDDHVAGAVLAVTPPPGSIVAPFAGRANGENRGLKSRLRDVYNRASAEERQQIDGLAAYLRGNIQAAANLTPGNDGGHIIPSFVVPTLERDYAAFAPVVSVARLWQTETGADTTFPVLSDSETAVQVASAATTGADATVSGDTPPTALTGPTLHAWKVSSKPVFIPRETFTDSPVDIVNEIVGALLARIIRFENLKYTTGNGTTEAEGFLTNATVFNAGSTSTVLDLDNVLDLAYSAPPLYRSQGAYMMSDTTAKYLRKLKTGISGDKRQLWADADATKGTPATLHGYPVVINNDMASVDADGTFETRNPVAFGDFSKFVVRQAENNQPFAYRYAVPAKDGGAVILFRRSDSKLLVPTAINKIAVS
jgi:HK97 family phage major capsid protein